MPEFCGVDGDRCEECGCDAASAGSLAGRLAAVNWRLDEIQREVAALERERVGLRDQLGLRPDDGRDQPKLFESDAQPSLFGMEVAFHV